MSLDLREVMPWRVGYLVQLVFLIKGTLLSFVVWLPQDILGGGSLRCFEKSRYSWVSAPQGQLGRLLHPQ